MERTNLLQRIMQRHWKTGFVFLSRTGSIRQGRINRLGNVRVRESRQGWDVKQRLYNDDAPSWKIVAIYSPIIGLFSYWWYLCRKKMQKENCTGIRSNSILRQFARNSSWRIIYVTYINDPWLLLLLL